MRLVGVSFLLLATSCATVAPPAPIPSPQAAAPPAVSAPPAATPPTSQSTAPPAVTPAPASGSPAQAVQPVAKAPVKALAPSLPKAKQESIAPAAAAKQSPPPLNLTSLEERLKGTNAIGVLTKITLKNQVDDLLDQFRAYYKGKTKTALSDLRRSFDMLVLKVLSLLQDSDPSLAAAIAASRDAIWGVLSDPAKFAAI
jgi:hypothetical protein